MITKSAILIQQEQYNVVHENVNVLINKAWTCLAETRLCTTSKHTKHSLDMLQHHVVLYHNETCQLAVSCPLLH